MPHIIELPDTLSIHFGGRRKDSFTRSVETASIPDAVHVSMWSHGYKQRANDRYADWTEADFAKEGVASAEEFLARCEAGDITTRATGGDPIARFARKLATSKVYGKLTFKKDKEWHRKDNGDIVDRETINAHINTLATSEAYLKKAQAALSEMDELPDAEWGEVVELTPKQAKKAKKQPATIE